MGSIVCFALFLGAVGVCLAEGWQLMWAIWAGIAVFAVLGLARHVPVRVMAAGAWRQGRKMCSVIDIYLLIGAITALWRSAGTIIAGAYFGDRCSPASSSAALVAAATGTVLERNLRRMHRTGWLPYVVSLAVYAALSVTHPLAAVDGQVLTTLAETYRLGWWTALPAAAIIVLPLCRVSIRRSMAVSVLAALAVTLWGQGGQLWDVLRDTVLGYRPAGGALQQVLAGGGVVSMLTATLMAISAGMYAGLLDSAGVLGGVRRHAAALARRAGRFPACAAVCALAGMIFCNQSAGPVVADQLLEETYRARGQGGEELALDIENSGIVMAPLIPWNISVSIPLVMLGADASAIPYEVLLYAIPLCYLLTKRRVFAAKGERI